MNIIPFYPYYHHNVGRIESIADGILHVSLNRGRGIKDIDLPVSACYDFQPQLHDRVLFCVDTDGDIQSRLLMKLKKSRQDAKEPAKVDRDIAENQRPQAAV